MIQKEIFKLFAQDEEIINTSKIKQEDFEALNMNGFQKHIILNLIRDLIELEANKDLSSRSRKSNY